MPISMTLSTADTLTATTPVSPIIQMPDTAGTNFYDIDHDLRSILARALSEQDFALVEPHLRELGALVGGELSELALEADANPPQLRTHDKRGVRIDEVTTHPAYQRMVDIAVKQFGLVALSHAQVLDFPAPAKHVVKYALWYEFGQAEFGLACPLSMTDAAARVLRRYGSPELNARYADQLIRTDAGFESASQFMTEKQGGSDVGANTVTASRDGDAWRLYGDKWFCSNVSADAALVLARPDGAPEGTSGLAMFVMPRVLPGGERNGYRILRLKDKLGTRDMASGEIDLNGAVAYQVGELGTGFKQMMSMVNSSRLSNAMRSAALMRRSVVEAQAAARGRWAFGSPLLDKPLMRDTLFRMVVASEAATAMLFRTAEIYDRSDRAVAEVATPVGVSVPSDPDSRLLRLLTPMLKGVICKRARTVVAEGMEARGGNGYIEEWGDARMVRDAHLGSIWEGTTSIVALDVQRALLRNSSGEPLFAHLREELAVAEATASDLQSGELLGLTRLLKDRTSRLERRVDGLSDLPQEQRELGAIGLMNTLYDLTAATLLLGQAATQLVESGNARKLAVLVGALRPSPLGDPTVDPAPSDVLLSGYAEEILSGGHVPVEAVEAAVDALLENAFDTGGKP
ncbi:DNA alkylation response protein [Leucobacter viscericola]|uniref:DNA alkylation response protein n=1 Tax=Leucobacter viscericola TaxID=2714935 RepID=A0A6G7XIM7_9MICO|nr:acyl-CoA dehydrogenase family protein [Leucobacter viscericola]QIK64425.1 DNA alkylation response protein [Leucobacter viscericola]